MNYTDIDIIRFLTNVECLEGLFDTWGTFGHGFINNLDLGGPTPIGARAANLTEATRPFLEEVALNEQVRREGRAWVEGLTVLVCWACTVLFFCALQQMYERVCCSLAWVAQLRVCLSAMGRAWQRCRCIGDRARSCGRR